ncbi:MAG: hypothetical protein IPM99_12100 [Rubrivivax sp.]|jgi:tetratricopeptide (TPR) repeat protein|nr:hypothetical protein [Rubrivivax sp.]
MMKFDPLQDIRELKQQAVALRNRDRLEAALEALERAESALEGLLAEPDLDPERRQQLAAELADTHGMKGGVQRRRQHMDEALSEYQAGAAVEGAEATTTYNLGNSVLLSLVLGRTTLNDAKTREDIDRLVARLERQVLGARADEWWAYADLAQFRLLRGDVAGAFEAYAAGRNTGPTQSEQQRPLDVMVEVAAAVKATHPQCHDDITAFVDWARGPAWKV